MGMEFGSAESPFARPPRLDGIAYVAGTAGVAGVPRPELQADVDVDTPMPGVFRFPTSNGPGSVLGDSGFLKSVIMAEAPQPRQEPAQEPNEVPTSEDLEKRNRQMPYPAERPLRRGDPGDKTGR